MKCFLSSVIRGFEAYRDAVAEGIETLGHDVIRSEDFGASPDAPRVACLAGVRDADAVALVIGARYGEPQKSGLSATHEEYREARERCPVLVFVQDSAELEPAQQEFLDEIRRWESGHMTETFSTPEELKTKITRVLHQWQLSRAAGEVDAQEMLSRAESLLPEQHGTGRPCLCVSVVGAPRQSILRPASLEDADFRKDLMREATYGDPAVLDPSSGTTNRIVDNALLLEQETASILLTPDGSVRITTPARTPERKMGLSVLIEEHIQECILDSLRFAAQTLDRIDPVNRFTDVVPVAALLGAGYSGWRTRAEHEAEPSSMAVGMGQPERAVVHLDPPTRKRAALSQAAGQVSEDLLVLLRREFKR